MQKNIYKTLGIIGTALCVSIFVLNPSFPTPDKLIILFTFIAMIFGVAIEMLKRFGPFVALILVYESFRGAADYLNSNVNFTPMIDVDKFIFFGNLPTEVFQNLLWHGSVMWYDFVFYLAYMMHFVFPMVLAVVIWLKFPGKYWNFMWTYVILMFAGFTTYLIFPAAPPWMAFDQGYIDSITRISSEVWRALGVQDFPTVYSKIAPNPVAAVPSLHAAFSFLFALYITKLFKTSWRYLAWIYPFLIIFGTVYMGEHYLIDAILGVVYAALAYKYTPKIQKFAVRAFAKIRNRVKLA